MGIKHLYMESMQIHIDEAKLISKFIRKDECLIEELELNEADIDIEALDEIMAALCKADNLRRLSLAKNELTSSICDHLRILPQQLHKFQSMCLSHCLMGEEGLESLCSGFYGDISLKYLDLSWNYIQPSGMQHILSMLRENKSLEKLYIQHNYLGEQGAEKMVEALEIHP